MNGKKKNERNKQIPHHKKSTMDMKESQEPTDNLQQNGYQSKKLRLEAVNRIS